MTLQAMAAKQLLEIRMHLFYQTAGNQRFYLSGGHNAYFQ